LAVKSEKLYETVREDDSNTNLDASNGFVAAKSGKNPKHSKYEEETPEPTKFAQMQIDPIVETIEEKDYHQFSKNIFMKLNDIRLNPKSFQKQSENYGNFLTAHLKLKDQYVTSPREEESGYILWSEKIYDEVNEVFNANKKIQMNMKKK